MFSSRFSFLQCTSGKDTRLLSKSSLRWGYIVNPSAAVLCWLSCDSMGSASIGYPLINNEFFYLNCRDHGDIVQNELHVFTATTLVVGFIEIMACDCESQELLKDALGHRMGDEDWHRRFGAKKR